MNNSARRSCGSETNTIPIDYYLEFVNKLLFLLLECNSEMIVLLFFFHCLSFYGSPHRLSLRCRLLMMTSGLLFRFSHTMKRDVMFLKNLKKTLNHRVLPTTYTYLNPPDLVRSWLEVVFFNPTTT